MAVRRTETLSSSRTTVVDARWAKNTGTTTFTRQVLQGLAETQPAGRWIVWGPPEMIGGISWPGAILSPTVVDPVAWFGQRAAFRVPRCDLVLHLHQTRPLHLFPAATCVLDLIQLQAPYSPLPRMKAARLAATVHAARALFTISTSVRDELVARFKVDPATVTVLRLPVDGAAATRVAARRADRPPGRRIVSIGRFTPHKNHRRLIDAFARTRFAATGGELHLVGGTLDELRVDAALPAGVRVIGAVDQRGLEDAMAGALVVVQASLVEGYGLPVTEALMAGVPVASSPVPAVTEFGPEGIPVFDPWSVDAISGAIDETVDMVEQGRYWDRVAIDAWRQARPTPRSLVEQILGRLADVR